MNQMFNEKNGLTEDTTPDLHEVAHATTGPLQAVKGLQTPPRKRLSRKSALLLLLVCIFVVGGGSLLFSTLSMPSSTLVAKTLAAQQGAVGQLVFANSGQLDPTGTAGLNDVVTVELSGIQPPAPGNAFYAWLRPGQGQDEVRSILLGALHVTAGHAHLTYSDPRHTDLLATYNGLLVTEEPAQQVPQTPSLSSSTWRYQAYIPTIPVPGDIHQYSLLSHLRHLLAQDPDVESAGLHGGLNLWLYRNSLSVVDEANTARDYWQTHATTLMHRQLVRILDYLDGFNYVRIDIPFIDPVTQVGTPFLIDRQQGAIGLLTFSQQQQIPGYLVHISLHLDGMLGSPGVSAGQKALAGQLDALLTQVVTPLFKKVHDDAALLVKMDAAQLQTSKALTLLNDMATSANAAVSGPVDPATGTVGKGVTYLHAIMEQLAIVTVERTAQGA